MSKFLNYYSYLIDIGATVAQFQAEIKSRLTTNGWQVVAEKVPVADDANARGILDVIPPASSPIGNGTHMEVTRFVFARSGVSITNYIRTVATPPAQSFTLTNTATATSTMKVLIEEHLISLSGVGSNTAAQNAALLLAQLQGSANEYVQMFTYNLVGTVITATAVSPSQPYVHAIPDSYSNPYVTVGGVTTDHNIYRFSRQPYQTISCDFTNGFIYFLTVNERSIVFSVKTVGNYYGPLVAFYQDHTIALAQTPTGLIPVESAIINISAITWGTKTMTALTHCWGMCHSSGGTLTAYHAANESNVGTNLLTGQIMSTSGTYINMAHTGLCGDTTTRRYTDITHSPSSTNGDITSACGYTNVSALGIIDNDANVCNVSANWTQVVPLSMNSIVDAQSYSPGPYPTTYYLNWLYPAITFEDALFANFTATSESLHYVKNLQTNSTLQTTMDGTTSYSTLDVGDASAFPASGTIIIDSETLEYTSKTGNTLNGITHAKYGTTKAAHAPGATVYVASWLVKINTGLHQVGFVKPTN